MNCRSDSYEPTLLPCRCGSMPVQDTKIITLGKVTDGGYSGVLGRYKCPNCGKAPEWGQGFCVTNPKGWINNEVVWNMWIRRSEWYGSEADEG